MSLIKMVFLKKSQYKCPKIRIFEKIRTRTDKFVRVGTLNECLNNYIEHVYN